MVRQFCYVHHLGDGLVILENLAKLDTVLVVHLDRRQALFVTMQVLIVKPAIACQVHHIRLLHHQIYDTCVLFYYLRLECRLERVFRLL